MAEIITKRDRIRGVLRHHAATYADQPTHWTFFDGRTPAEVQEALRQLDLETCPEDHVTAVIGNGSWTALVCDLCGEEQSMVAMLEDHNDRNQWMYGCRSCLEAVATHLEAMPDVR